MTNACIQSFYCVVVVPMLCSTIGGMSYLPLVTLVALLRTPYC